MRGSVFHIEQYLKSIAITDEEQLDVSLIEKIPMEIVITKIIPFCNLSLVLSLRNHEYGRDAYELYKYRMGTICGLWNAILEDDDLPMATKFPPTTVDNLIIIKYLESSNRKPIPNILSMKHKAIIKYFRKNIDTAYRIACSDPAFSSAIFMRILPTQPKHVANFISNHIMIGSFSVLARISSLKHLLNQFHQWKIKLSFYLVATIAEDLCMDANILDNDGYATSLISIIQTYPYWI
jgi:hypothetical protein